MYNKHFPVCRLDLVCGVRHGPFPRMQLERLLKPDGRYLLLYTFAPPAAAAAGKHRKAVTVLSRGAGTARRLRAPALARPAARR